MIIEKEVNLISLEAQKAVGYQKVKKKAKNFFIGLSVIFLIASLLVFAVFFALKKESSANKEKAANLKKQINSFSKNESYIITITGRSEKINSLLKSRKPFYKSISDLDLLLVPGFNLMSMDFGSQGELKIVASCSDNQSMQLFNDRLEQLSSQGLFSQITYSSVSRTKTGKYDFTIQLKK